jgi:hypothetical protein
MEDIAQSTRARYRLTKRINNTLQDGLFITSNPYQNEVRRFQPGTMRSPDASLDLKRAGGERREDAEVRVSCVFCASVAQR